MKKDKLIELLQSLPGNPDIKLWNGLVRDWMDIDPTPVETTIVKMSFETMVKHCFNEDVVRNGRDQNKPYSTDELAELRKAWLQNHKYEFNNFVTSDDVKSGEYKQKKIVVLQAKLKGVNTFDRLGNYSY